MARIGTLLRLNEIQSDRNMFLKRSNEKEFSETEEEIKMKEDENKMRKTDSGRKQRLWQFLLFYFFLFQLTAFKTRWYVKSILCVIPLIVQTAKLSQA